MSLSNLARSNPADVATAADAILRAKLEHARRQPLVQQIVANNEGIRATVAGLVAERDAKIAALQKQIDAIWADYGPRIAALEAQRSHH